MTLVFLVQSESNPTLLESGNLLDKLLGVNCAPSDSLSLKTVTLSFEANTKRCILLEVASFFDPLGLLSPVIMNAKCYMQSLWKAELK